MKAVLNYAVELLEKYVTGLFYGLGFLTAVVIFKTVFHVGFCG